MKAIILVSFFVLVICCAGSAELNAASPVRQSQVCLKVGDIQRTEIPDDRTIIFHMRGGKVWKNKLRTICPMLKIGPYSEVLHGPDIVCSNQQFIHVAQTGQTCVLGEFTPWPNH